MPAIKLKPIESVDLWELQNKDVKIAVEKKTGFIRSLFFKRKKVDLFQQLKQNIPGYIGGIRIYDEKDEKWYNDLNDGFSLKNGRKSGNSVSFVKKFKGCPFSLKIKLNLEGDFFHWEVEATKNNNKVADRSLRVFFFMPILAGWNIWAPCCDGQFVFDGMTSFEFNHIQVPCVSPKDIILPMVSHYQKGLDVGFSMMEPMEAQVPAAKFQFSNGHKMFNWGAMEKDIRDVPVLEAVNYYIGLVGNRKMSTKIMMTFHGGDWRPALGKVFKRWKPFFTPGNSTIYDFEGTFSSEGIQTAKDIKRCKDFNIKTLEVHRHFENYCDYYQEGRDKWFKTFVMESYYHKYKHTGINGKEVKEFFDKASFAEISKEFTGDMLDRVDQKAITIDKNGNKILDDLYHTRENIKACLKKLNDNGVGCYWYFNYTDGFRPVVEKRWPDAIAKNEDGTDQPSGWHMCHNMNADPKYSFGKFAIESAKKIFEEYPTLKGFFLDCFRHFEVDFGHDDGVTVVNNKPAYSMNFSYDKVEEIIKTQIMKKKKLASFCNKPQSIRTLRYTDGLLLEGDGDVRERKFFWGAIGMPLFFMWTSDQKGVDENLRRAVLLGSYPKFALGGKDYEDSKKLFQAYMPLYKEFKRRVLCFDPDPMRVPDGSRGEIFTVGKDYVAGIISENFGPGDEIKWANRPHAVFKVQKGCDIGKVGVMYPGTKKLEKVKFQFDGTFIYVPMEKYRNCAVVKLFVTKNTKKKIIDRPFLEGKDYCGDPESSFEDISTR